MTKPADIIESINTLLSGDATLSAYVKTFLLGERKQIVKFPAVMTHQVGIKEADMTFGTQNLHMTVMILGAAHVVGKDKQIIGDGTIKGILDLENDVKKAISSDRTLGGTVIHISIVDTTYDDSEYPIKGFGIELDVYFRQNTTVRT